MWIKDVFMSCRNAIRLISKREIEKLTVVEKLELKLHLAACKFCNEYNKQNKLVQSFLEEKNKKNAVGLAPEFKEKMKVLIESNLSQM